MISSWQWLLGKFEMDKAEEDFEQAQAKLQAVERELPELCAEQICFN